MPTNRPPRADNHSGFIIARLSSGLPLRDTADLRVYAETHRLFGLIAVLEAYDLNTARPLVQSLSPARIVELERAAARTMFPPLHSLTSYWRIDAHRLVERGENAIVGLERLPEVDRAYLERIVTEPLARPDDDPYAADQGYLDAAETGIGARWAWKQMYGDGAGVGLVDLEQGWLLRHEDLDDKSPTLICGDNRDGIDGYEGNHGAAVLGIICAEDNNLGGIGIAPGVTSVRMVSRYDRSTGSALNVADAITKAIDEMSSGDVLLLEVERDLKPTETDDADFDAIRLASAYDIIVVEPAGNKGADLDTYLDEQTERKTLNRADPGFLDSGAIMVGAAQAALPHERWVDSNYGTRVDCYGWGNEIVTCGYGDLDNGGGDPTRSYTNTFGNTSGAAAIAAGAALVLQGKYQTTGARLSPARMRALLSEYGTPQGGDTSENIGVMPDLRKLFHVLRLVPDVYLRDNVSDTGDVPSEGSISASPDIIVRPDLVADPQGSFGAGSGTEESMTLGFQVEAGQNNFVYVRAKNRGKGDAINTTATVYWSEVATLVTPDLWHPIGTTKPFTVPEGDALVVADPLIWPAADIPASGHYCFVAVLSQPEDEGPLQPAGPPYFDFDDFRAYVRGHNNVTWRNFNIIDAIDDGAQASLPLMFNGAPDQARTFDLEFARRLPAGAQVWLEAPLSLALKLNTHRSFKMDVARDRGMARLLLPAEVRLRLHDVPLGGRIRYRARLLVRGSKGTESGGHSIAIRQIYEGTEVGRVTWQFHRRRSKR